MTFDIRKPSEIESIAKMDAGGPLADQVYGQILAQILGGTLEVGAKLPSENAYSTMLSVSRPVVRAALSRLAADGIVESCRGSGTYLRRRPSQRLSELTDTSDVANLLQCIEFRIELEGASAALAAERHTQMQLRDIAKAYDRLMSEAHSDFITAESDFAFHTAIAAACGNIFYIDAMRMVQATSVKLMKLSLGLTKSSAGKRVEQVVNEHTMVFDAIKAREPALAGAAMRLHLARSRYRITENEGAISSEIKGGHFHPPGENG